MVTNIVMTMTMTPNTNTTNITATHTSTHIPSLALGIHMRQVKDTETVQRK